MKYTSRHNKKSSDKEENEMYKKFDLHEVPEFSVGFRGYNKYETNKYLNALVNAYIRLFEENLYMKSELEEYRRKKAVISDTLITAEYISQIAKKQLCTANSFTDFGLETQSQNQQKKKTPEIKQTDSIYIDIEELIRDIKNRNGS